MTTTAYKDSVYAQYALYKATYGREPLGCGTFSLPAGELMRYYAEDFNRDLLFGTANVVELCAGMHENSKFVEATYTYPMKYHGIDLLNYDHPDHCQGDIRTVSYAKPDGSPPDIILSLFFTSQTTCAFTIPQLKALWTKCYNELGPKGCLISHMVFYKKRPAPFNNRKQSTPILNKKWKAMFGAHHNDDVRIEHKLTKSFVGNIMRDTLSGITLFINNKATHEYPNLILDEADYSPVAVMRTLKEIGFTCRYHYDAGENLPSSPILQRDDSSFYILAMKGPLEKAEKKEGA